VDLAKLLGRPCLLNVVHVPSKKDAQKIYANIASASQPDPRLMPAAPQVKPFAWEIGMPDPVPEADWLPWSMGSKVPDLIRTSQEWEAAHGPAPAGQPPQQAANGSAPQQQAPAAATAPAQPAGVTTYAPAGHNLPPAWPGQGQDSDLPF
jgi:hypothetical protein